MKISFHSESHPFFGDNLVVTNLSDKEIYVSENKEIDKETSDMIPRLAKFKTRKSGKKVYVSDSCGT